MAPTGRIRNALPLIGGLIRPYVPAYDLTRRRQVRQSTRELVQLTRWPGLDATSQEAAQLALLRLLDLQRQIRRSSKLRQSEGAALLARTAIDTCITGMFCLHVPEAISRLKADNSKSASNMMRFLLATGAVSELASNAAKGVFGNPRRLETPTVLLKEIEEAGGPTSAGQLYDRVINRCRSFSPTEVACRYSAMSTSRTAYGISRAIRGQNAAPPTWATHV
jgi:hypothetical protein